MIGAIILLMTRNKLLLFFLARFVRAFVVWCLIEIGFWIDHIRFGLSW